MKKIFIIILNWNGKKDTLECLESLAALAGPAARHLVGARSANKPLRANKVSGSRHPLVNISIVLVDNGSTDGSVEEVEKRYKDIKILRNKENLGFAEGNNVGIRHAMENGADVVILLNNDTLVEENLVEELTRVADSDPRIGVISPKIYFAPGFEFHKDRYTEEDRGKVIWYAGGKMDWRNVLGSHRGVDEVDHGQYNKQEETDFTTGCCMLVKKDVFEKIGLLDKKYFAYWEDNDFCQRAKKVGYRILYVPRAFLWHKNAASSDKPGSAIHQYYQTRNRLLFGFRYASLRTKVALFRESLKFLIAGGIKGKAILDFYLGHFGRGSYPI